MAFPVELQQKIVGDDNIIRFYMRGVSMCWYRYSVNVGTRKVRKCKGASDGLYYPTRLVALIGDSIVKQDLCSLIHISELMCNHLMMRAFVKSILDHFNNNVDKHIWIAAGKNKHVLWWLLNMMDYHCDGHQARQLQICNLLLKHNITALLPHLRHVYFANPAKIVELWCDKDHIGGLMYFMEHELTRVPTLHSRVELTTRIYEHSASRYNIGDENLRNDLKSLILTKHRRYVNPTRICYRDLNLHAHDTQSPTDQIESL